MTSKVKQLVGCSECKKGGNGDQTCLSGWFLTEPDQGGCFMGVPSNDLKFKEPPSIA